MAEKKALLIGVWNYPGDELVGPEHDLRDWRRLAESFEYTVHELPDSAAKKSDIKTSIENLLTGAGDDHKLMLYFSGHGTRYHDGTRYRDGIVASPAAGGRPQPSDVIFDDELEQWIVASHLRKTKAQLTIVLDCCHAAGTASQDAYTFRDRGSGIKRRFLSLDGGGAGKAGPRSDRSKEPHWVTATDNDDDPAYETSIGNEIRGVFSYAFAKVVRDANNNITHAAATVAADWLMRQYVSGQHCDQDGPRRKNQFLR